MQKLLWQEWGQGGAAEGQALQALASPELLRASGQTTRAISSQVMWPSIPGKREMGEADTEDFTSIPW